MSAYIEYRDISQYSPDLRPQIPLGLCPGFRPVAVPSPSPACHLLPVHKQPEIGAFIIIAHQIAVQAHGRTAG